MRTITVSCSSARLTDIDNQIHDSNILSKQSPAGTWLLNANIVIAEEATFHIDSTDTKWLKIVSDQAITSLPYNIDVHGSLKIDSVKITSWDPTTNKIQLQTRARIYSITTNLLVPIL
jgi:mannuronan 5-epimerase